MGQKYLAQRFEETKGRSRDALKLELLSVQWPTGMEALWVFWFLCGVWVDRPIKIYLLCLQKHIAHSLLKVVCFLFSKDHDMEKVLQLLVNP